MFGCMVRIYGGVTSSMEDNSIPVKINWPVPSECTNFLKKKQLTFFGEHGSYTRYWRALYESMAEVIQLYEFTKWTQKSDYDEDSQRNAWSQPKIVNYRCLFVSSLRAAARSVWIYQQIGSDFEGMEHVSDLPTQPWYPHQITCTSSLSSNLQTDIEPLASAPQTSFP